MQYVNILTSISLYSKDINDQLERPSMEGMQLGKATLINFKYMMNDLSVNYLWQ